VRDGSRRVRRSELLRISGEMATTWTTASSGFEINGNQWAG
jgi:hypothetical protein